MRATRLLMMVMALAATVILSAAEIKLPAEKARLAESPLPGHALAVQYCYTCHSTDYLQYQPRTTTRATWKASVIKMQKTFGAPIPDSAIEPLAEYLAQTYGADHANAKSSGSTKDNANKR